MRVVQKLPFRAGHERTVRNEPVERIADEGKLEKRLELPCRQVRPKLLQADVTVLQFSEFRNREFLLHEQAYLFDVLRT